MLYGCSPFADQSAEQLDLKPAMTLSSELIATQHLQPGERVGYGFSYEAVGEMTIGVVACGYADGYPRHAPSGTPVLVNGKRTRTVGRVSMDMICVDISDIPEAYIGIAGDAVGRGPVRPTRWRRRPAPSATSCCARWRRACRWRKLPRWQEPKPPTSAPTAARPRCNGSAAARRAAPPAPC